MRTLKFIVEGPVIKPDPECDFSGLVPGLQAEFTFSKEWASVPKVVAFYSRLGNEYPPQALKDGKICTIPTEALRKRIFKVQVWANDTYVLFRVEYLNATSLDEVKAFMASQNANGTPLTVQYVLATPIETPLTAEEIAAFKALRTNYPNTTILNDAGAWMSVKYNADTKSYVDKPKTLRLTDTSTGVVYELKVVDGNLTVVPV